MILKSFSKINLSLKIIDKLKRENLHNLQSYYCLINLFDVIKIEKIKGSKDKVVFTGKFSGKISKKRNSVLNTLTILRDKNILSGFYSVLINKRIPVFAGLGGGTSNAAYLIRYFTKNKISKNVLDELVSKIGSDLRLFLHSQGFLSNLKKNNKFTKKFKLYFLLVFPNIKCSSKYVYSKIKRNSYEKKGNFFQTKDKSKFIKFIKKEKNSLQSIVEDKYPIFKRIIKDMDKRPGCYFSRMTGSGSVCYGVFKSKKTAKAALKTVRSKYPNYWFSVAKTI